MRECKCHKNVLGLTLVFYKKGDNDYVFWKKDKDVRTTETQYKSFVGSMS